MDEPIPPIEKEKQKKTFTQVDIKNVKNCSFHKLNPSVSSNHSPVIIVS